MCAHVATTGIERFFELSEEVDPLARLMHHLPCLGRVERRSTCIVSGAGWAVWKRDRRWCICEVVDVEHAGAALDFQCNLRGGAVLGIAPGTDGLTSSASATGKDQGKHDGQTEQHRRASTPAMA